MLGSGTWTELGVSQVEPASGVEWSGVSVGLRLEREMRVLMGGKSCSQGGRLGGDGDTRGVPQERAACKWLRSPALAGGTSAALTPTTAVAPASAAEPAADQTGEVLIVKAWRPRQNATEVYP